MCVSVCLCVAKPVAVELRCHATALIIIYPLNGYFTIDSAPIYNKQEHPAFLFSLSLMSKQLFPAP